MSGGGYGSDDTSAWQDMRDGGGKGRSGGEFEGGGIISTIGNAMGGPGNAPFTIGGENNRIPNPAGTSFGRDLINGGGLGHMGDFHRGMGPYSLLANMGGSLFGRDNVTIDKMLQDLEEDDDFLSKPSGLRDYTMQDIKFLDADRFQQMKQQHLSDNFGRYSGQTMDGSQIQNSYYNR
jgi:hypothetical protein